MSYFRSYFEKNNTIIKNSQVNTAKNPTTEIFYGSGFSKFLFKVDFTDLISKVNSYEYIVTTGTTHTLHLTNTIFGDETFLGAKRGTGRQRTNSFDLILFRISEFWDEGLGFDYEDGGYDFTTGNHTFDERPSNWFQTTTINNWSYPGLYNNTNTIPTTSLSGLNYSALTIVDTQHFEFGNEDINFNMTSEINGILNGSITGVTGWGIAYVPEVENISGLTETYSVGFFTRHTQTFYQPFLQTTYDDIIKDDRNTFAQNRTNQLYLYVYQNGDFVNLDKILLLIF